jgi:hypothetical protein
MYKIFLYINHNSLILLKVFSDFIIFSAFEVKNHEKSHVKTKIIFRQA